MKSQSLLIFLLFAITTSLEHSEKPMARNTKRSDCRGEGGCIYYCEFQGERIFPGEPITQKGKCRQLRCDRDFNIYIKTCYMHRASQMTMFDPNGQFQYLGEDLSVEYPDCCGYVDRNFDET